MAQATLLHLPRELRDIIYHFTFAGSRLHFVPAYCDKPSRWGVTGDVGILSTCTRCYEEGRLVFWDEVIVYGSDGWPGTSLSRLSECLSDFAKSRIQHVRSVVGDCISNPSDIRLGLSKFPRLKTCAFNGQFLVSSGTYSNFSNGDQKGWCEFAVSRQFPDSDPRRVLESQ